MASSTAARKHHAVAIPLPAQGHMNSLMRLCKKLASEEGFTITFVNIDPMHYRIEEVGAEEEEERKLETALDIRRAHIPIDGLDFNNDFRFSFVHFFEAMQGLAPHLEKLLLTLTSTPQEPPVSCLISDFLLTGPSHQLAHRFNLPHIVFYPFSPSMLLYMDYILHGDIPQNRVLDAVKKGEKRFFCAGLPGLPTLNNEDLLSFKHLEDNNEYMYEFTWKVMQESSKGGHAMVVNSLKDLEEGALKALEARMRVPVYAVGPLVEDLQEVETATSLWKEDKGCMKWLDEQAVRSVLYISFGSITCLSRLQFEELVNGLLCSKHPFLFVFRPDLVVEHEQASPSPLQLLRSNAGKGYVAEWTPQTAVLSHPSVGAFLTHCGLNSIMEALAYGVPMLCWPYFLDQFMNAKFVVEEWKVGLRFCSNSDSFVTRHEVENTIQALMEGEHGKEIRKNAERLKEVCRRSLFPGGTSCKSLQGLIQSL